ncbi:MAG: Ig-like domain-containing protein [Bacteroidales bacterium]|nr:Ig-like domain-containing protein [Bacteroidales bacterium]
MKERFILLIACLLSGLLGFSQTITNVGTDFWIAFPPNWNNTVQHFLFISSNFSTSGTVTSAFPGVDQNFTVIPGVVTQLSIPGGVALEPGIEDKGIHVTSLEPISLYGLSRISASTDAYLALPINALGTDYRIMCYPVTVLPNNASCFSVVAVQDGTALTIYNHLTAATSNINLNQGQTYHVEAIEIGEDLTGSRVQSNVPVAVFGSNDITNVTSACSAADHLVEQLFPYYSWGKNYVTVPLAGRDESGDIFRILAAEDGTDIEINGSTVITINEGDVYETSLSGFNSIITSKAALLAQFAKGISCSGSITGDPFMMQIPPREQFLTNYTVGTVSGFNEHWVNVVAPDYALGTILQDGVAIPAGAFTQISTTSFYGAQRSVTEGSHTFTSTFPFGVFSYGWASVDSYGYAGGGSLSPVGTVDSVSISPDTLYGELNVTSICLTAHVLNNLGNPVEGVLVNFNISGVSTINGSAYTNASGDAQYCYTQTGTTPGMDEVFAEIFGFLSDTAVVFWSYLPPCVDPTDGGSIGDPQSGCGTHTPSPLTNLLLPSGQTGTLEYKWQVSVVSGSAGFTDIPSSNAATYAPGAITQTSWYRRLARVDCMPDWNGAVESNVIELIVIPPLPVSISISASANDTCDGAQVTFSGAAMNGGSTPAYQWKVNGISVGTNDPVYMYNPTSGDQVSCILTSSESCSTGNPASSNSVIMTVLETPEVTFTPCFDTITTENASPLQLKGGIPLGGTYSGSGTGWTSETGWTFYPAIAGPGIHQITYSYTNTALCSDARYVTIDTRSASPFSCGDDLVDIRDNQTYSTVQIGTQCWMAANLDYGNEIPLTSSQRDNCIPEKYKPAVGSWQLAVYQWDELMGYSDTEEVQGLCPPGWHVPSETEWDQLFTVFLGNGFAGSPLLSTGYSGFNALLSGAGIFNTTWIFPDFAAYFWSSTTHGPWKAWAHGMNTYNYSVSYYPSYRDNAFSVRCIRD